MGESNEGVYVIDFFIEELPFILVALFVFGIVFFLATRPFVPSRRSVFIILATFLVLSGLLWWHYTHIKTHIVEVSQAFQEGKTILCVDKTNRASGGIAINKSAFWELKDEQFFHSELKRSYNVRQCIIE